MEKKVNQRREEKNKIKNIIYMSTGVFSRRREGRESTKFNGKKIEKKGQSERNGQQRKSSGDRSCLSMRGKCQQQEQQ